MHRPGQVESVVHRSPVAALLRTLLAVLAFSAVACASSSPYPTASPEPTIQAEPAVTPEATASPEPSVTNRETGSVQNSAARADVHFVGAELGRAISKDWTLADPTTIFGLHDTIYVLITTDGRAPETTLSVH